MKKNNDHSYTGNYLRLLIVMAIMKIKEASKQWERYKRKVPKSEQTLKWQDRGGNGAAFIRGVIRYKQEKARRTAFGSVLEGVRERRPVQMVWSVTMPGHELVESSPLTDSVIARDAGPWIIETSETKPSQERVRTVLGRNQVVGSFYQYVRQFAPIGTDNTDGIPTYPAQFEITGVVSLTPQEASTRVRRLPVRGTFYTIEEDQAWDTKTDQCAKDLIKHEYGWNFDHKNATIDSIIEFLANKGVSSHIIGDRNKVVAREIAPNRSHKKAFVAKVANNHISSIQSADARQEIVKTRKLMPATPNWEGGVVKYVKDVTKYLEREHEYLPENIRCNGSKVTRFSRGKTWYVDSPWKKIQRICEKEELAFKGQSYGHLAKQIIEKFQAELPTSQLSSKVYSEMTPEGGHVETYRTSEIGFACDVSKCYSSIIRNRRHAFGFFNPSCQVEKWDRKIVEGAKYYLRPFKLGCQDMIGRFYDSEFVEWVMNVAGKEPTKMILPSMTVGNDYFVLGMAHIEEKYPKRMKQMLNSYIGSLGMHKYKTTDAFVTDDQERMEIHLGQAGNVRAMANGTWLCYKQSRGVRTETNLPIMQGTIDSSYRLLYEIEMANPKNEVLWIKTDCIAFAHPYKRVKSDSFKFRDEEYTQKCVKTRVPWAKAKVEPKANRGKLITGAPGRGKTWMIANKLGGERTQVLAYTHKACDNLRTAGIECQTISSFLHTQKSWQAKASAIARNVSRVIIDECFMCPPGLMSKIYTLFQLGVEIILVGDSKQLPAVEVTYDYTKAEFIKEMCPERINLTKNYRFDEGLDKLIEKVWNMRWGDVIPER